MNVGCGELFTLQGWIGPETHMGFIDITHSFGLFAQCESDSAGLAGARKSPPVKFLTTSAFADEMG